MPQVELTYEIAYNTVDTIVSQASLSRQGHIELQQCMLKLKELIDVHNKPKEEIKEGLKDDKSV